MAAAERITPGQIKKTNRQLIYDYIYQRKKVSQQDIAYALRLSRPTVASNLSEMEEAGLVRKNGQLDQDQIGRKAMAYSVVPDYRIAIGAELTERGAKVIAVDLYGAVMDQTLLHIRYEDQDAYYKRIGEGIQAFITALPVEDLQILGVGLSVQALVHEDGSSLFFSKILFKQGLNIDVFARHLRYPCRFIHDAEAAALSELWVVPELTDAVYFSLGQHLGGALLLDQQIRTGKHGHSALFEHMQVQPKGKICYCGKRGCLETLCSLQALLGEEPADGFFKAVRSGAPEQKKRWHTYLKHLGNAIYHLHLFYDEAFVLGGQLSCYLDETDVQFLYEEIQKRCPYEETNDFIFISKMLEHSVAIGAALPYIRRFLEHIDADEKK